MIALSPLVLVCFFLKKHLKRTFKIAALKVLCVAFSPDGEEVVAAGQSGILKVPRTLPELLHELFRMFRLWLFELI